MICETRDIVLRIPRDARIDDLPELIAAGLTPQFRGRNKPVVYVPRRRSRNANPLPPAA